MVFRKFLLNGGLVLIATIIITLPTANCTKYDNSINYNNLTEIVPLDYNVKIRLFFKDNILLGQCDIIIRINRVLNSIILNSVPVHVFKAVLFGRNIAIESSSAQLSMYILIIDFHQAIPLGTYNLKITYARIIHENGNISLPVYQDKLGVQMLNERGIEVMTARELFPCRDRDIPIISTTIKIAIKHDEKYTVLSNMLIRARNKTSNHMIWTDFDESLSMSIEHILIVITTFTNVSLDFENVTIWCRQSARQQIYYARDVLEKIIPYFRQPFFQKKYSWTLSKLDIIAFWHSHDGNDATIGLVLLREADIIYNETLHPVIRKREVAHMIAQQLALLWCEDALLWLKEGFVKFFGAYTLDQIYEDDHMMDLMVVQAQQDSFRYDTPSTINSSTLSTNISQVISLKFPPNDMKSFIIWRMIYHIIPYVFWRSIRTYIEEHRIYLHKTPDDLWNTMQTLYNKTNSNHNQSNILNSHLKEIITSWIRKKYYFVLNVTQHFTPVLNFKIEYILSPYLLVNDETKIWISVTHTWQSLNINKVNHQFWITSNIPQIVFTEDTLKRYFNKDWIIGLSDWIIVNIQQTGYYRVQYNLKNWEKLSRYLNSGNYSKIHILNRAQIIDDAFYFFLQRELNYDLFWNLTRFVTQDANFVTWYPMIKAFESFICLYPLKHGKKVTINMKNRINQLLTKIGYTEEPTDHTLTIYLRQEAVKWACMLNVSKCQEVATSEFNKELQKSVKNSNLIGKKWIYCHGLKTANHTIWYEIWQKWNVTSKESYLEYLTCSENYEIICNFLKITLFEEVQPDDNERITRRANAFLVTVAKHANKLNPCWAEIFNKISLSSNRRNDIIATLIVIITHMHSVYNMAELRIFAKVHYEASILQFIESKIRKRRSEYGRLINNYGYYFDIIESI